MDTLKFLLYILSRIGVMIVLVLFSAFTGEILFPFIVTFIPHTWAIKEILVTDNFGSVFGFLIILAFFLRLFYDDGKKQSAYETWSSVNITIVYILMILVYTIPSVFRESFLAEGKGEIFYEILYYPCYWLMDMFNMPYMVSVLVGMGLLLFASFAIYILAYKLYRKKHPELYRIIHNENISEES